MKTYRIVRMYQNPAIVSEWIDTGLTLEEAQAHCKDPETSSSTATHIKHTTLTKTFGAWFDGYEEEE
jgi:putative NADPH-quinone reductase